MAVAKKKKRARHHAHLQDRVGDDLWTPVNEELLNLLRRIKDEYGTWDAMGWAGRCSQRWLRHVMDGDYVTLGYPTLDNFLNNLGYDGYVQEMEWYTAEELVERGIWKEQPPPPPHPKSKLRLAVEETQRKREENDTLQSSEEVDEGGESTEG